MRLWRRLTRSGSWLALVGDSPNDVFMFSYFPRPVGLANVVKFRGRLDAKPTLVTPSEGGDGFAQLTSVILAARGTT